MQLWATTQDAAKKVAPFAASFPVFGHFSTRQRKTQIQDLHLTPDESIETPMTDDVTESYHELPSFEDLQIFAKRVYCCVPFLLLSLVPFVLFYCIIAKAVGFFRCFFCFLLVLTEKIPWDWKNTSKNIVEFLKTSPEKLHVKEPIGRTIRTFVYSSQVTALLLPGTPNNQLKMDGNGDFQCKDLAHHPIETTIYKWLALGYQVDSAFWTPESDFPSPGIQKQIQKVSPCHFPRQKVLRKMIMHGYLR